MGKSLYQLSSLIIIYSVVALWSVPNLDSESGRIIV